MSKSLGNIQSLQDAVNAGIEPIVIRYFLLTSSHYRNKLRLDQKGLEEASDHVRRFQEFSMRLKSAQISLSGTNYAQEVKTAQQEFRNALNDDLNLPKAMGFILPLMRRFNKSLERPINIASKNALLALFSEIYFYLDIDEKIGVSLSQQVEMLIEERNIARKEKDFARSDALRKQIQDMGYTLEDTPQGVVIK